ncbi:MAG: DUF1080 domain-containing protein [Armatimonadetes bacterium]|nr:DUF1080 domain-containing protein [Armatimonadota bacterium]
MRTLALLALFACAACLAADDTVFEDRFADPGLSADWEQVAGSWGIHDGQLANAEAVPSTVLAVSTTWDHYTLEVRMKTDQPGARPWSVARILFRYNDQGTHYYLVLHQGGTLELGKEQGGVHMPGLATARNAGDPLDWRQVRISADGPRIRASVDGREFIDFTDPSPIPSGRIGLDAFQGSMVRFDDVRLSSATLAQRTRDGEDAMRSTLQSVGYTRSPRGNVAIFRDSAVPLEESAPSDPEHVAQMVRRTGCGATFLTAAQMAVPGVLAKANFDVLVLPYGSAFPREAVPALKEFLRQRGSLLSTGGYFGDNLYGSREVPEAERLLGNPGFEDGLANWSASHETDGLRVEAVREPVRSGEGAVGIAVTDQAKVDFYSALQRVDGVKPRQDVLLTAWVKTETLKDGVGAYIAMSYFGADGVRISWSQSSPIATTQDWTRLQVRGTIPAGTEYVTVNLLLNGRGRAWFDDVELVNDTGGEFCLNTREGDIHGPGNSLRVRPDQIGVFDPSYRLEQVTSLRTSPGQLVTDAALEVTGEVGGYSASGMFIGNGNPVKAATHARPIYLLDAFDRAGNLRGRAGALIRNYLGAYAGSDWAVFGVNSADLFAPASPEAGKLFGDTLRAMLDKTYLAEVHPEFACYREGEPVTVEALIANYMPQERNAQVRFVVHAGRSDDPAAFETVQSVSLPAGSKTTVRTTWQPGSFATDFFTVSAALILDGQTTDRHENAFVVWRDDELSRAPRWTTKDAYLARDGETAFLCGTGDAGYPYHAESENPLVWDEQFRLMRDMGLRYYRCMHFFGDYPANKSLESLDDLPKEQLRRLDALVYLAHKHGLGFLFVNNVGLQLARDDDADLQGRRRALSLLAQRYAKAGGFMFNMDHQEFIRAGGPGVDEAFRRFLQTKYADYPALAHAWGLDATGSFADVKFDENAARADAWGSARGMDTGEFLCTYRDAWRQNASTAIHEGNRGALYCQDFSMYWWPDFMWPRPDVLADIDMTSAHFYGDQFRFPHQLKRADMQVLGKPLGQTEFGILTHPAWAGHRDCRLTHDGADEFFMMATHYCLGVGATMMSNWNWKENKECIFPWSIAHHDLVPKEHLRAYRNAAVLFSGIRPRYEPPEVFVVVPNAHLRTNKVGQVDGAVRDCIDRLMRRRVRFGLIGEEHLDSLPQSARALFYPVPFCPEDSVFAELIAFVEKGGHLYFSGDITFDPSCRRAREERLETLAGCRFTTQNYPHLEVLAGRPGEPCIRVEATTGNVLVDFESGPRLVLNELGGGQVLFAPDPIEARAGTLQLEAEAPHAGAGDPYELLLSLAEVERIPLAPPDSAIHSFQHATQEGGTIYVLFNTAEEPKRATLTHAGRSLELTLTPKRPALAHFDARGALVAVECQEEASLDGDLLWFGSGHFALMSLDGADLGGEPYLIAVLAIGTGQARISCASGIGDALVQHGQFSDLHWQALGEEPRGDGVPTVTASEERRSTVSLVCPRGRLPEAARLIEGLVQR